MALNRLGEELTDALTKRPPPPVTVPELEFLKQGPPLDNEPERREVAAKFAEHRIVAAGRNAWDAIARAERETFESWKAVSRALAVVGKPHALRVSEADAPNGCHYTAALTDWLTKNFGNRPMPKATRYWCCRMHEHLPDIEQWRATLPESRRARLINPLSVCRGWLRATQPRSRCADDPVKAATVAWQRFRSCLERLPADEAAPLWQLKAAEATIHIS